MGRKLNRRIAVDTDKSKTMSKKKHSDISFTNEETVRKRAWIEKALASVKGRFSSGEDRIESTEKASKPDLYVVNTNRPR